MDAVPILSTPRTGADTKCFTMFYNQTSGDFVNLFRKYLLDCVCKKGTKLCLF
jgi:hypothetical protein